jgi:hypothetical protein
LLSARSSHATHQRSRNSPSRQRVTLEVTRCVTDNADSIGLVEHSVRRNGPLSPNRSTVSVSSRPSRRLAAASGLTRESHFAVVSSDFLAS